MHAAPDHGGLKGQLEDLPLIDMLQIAGFSKKTGYLQIECPQGRGGVVFDKGLVVCAFSWSTLRYLRQIRDGEGEKAKNLLEKLIEYALQELVTQRKGEFHFQVTQSIPQELGGTSIAPLILDEGINSESLLLELAKGLDEEQRDTSQVLGGSPHSPQAVPENPPREGPSEAVSPSEAGDEPSPEDDALRASGKEAKPSSSPAPRPEGVGSDTSVLLVDDESPVRQVVGTVLRSAGFRVYTASSPSEGLGLASEIALTGEHLMVVTDLGMPTTSGRSFRGGLELARTLQRNGVATPVLLMAEKISPKARSRAKALGVRKVMLKPGLSKLDPEQYNKDLEAFARSLIRFLQNSDEAPVPEDHVVPAPGGEDKTSAPFLDFIVSMTEQLLDPKRSVDVSRLVLEVASKYLERGILFLIKGEKASGLGGFGLGSAHEVDQEIAQKIRFNIHDARPFAEVVYGGKTQRFSAEHDFLQMTLYAAVGKGRANECILMPMLNNSELLVILYGDNTGSGRPIGKLRGLELFIAQAGMTLENTFLHQRLRALESQKSRGDNANADPEVESA